MVDFGLAFTGALALIVASIPIRFGSDMVGDLYKELVQEKWLTWIRHFKTHAKNPKGLIEKIDELTIIKQVKEGIKQDLDYLQKIEQEMRNK